MTLCWRRVSLAAAGHAAMLPGCVAKASRCLARSRSFRAAARRTAPANKPANCLGGERA